MTIELQPSLGLQAAIEQRRATRSFRPDPIPPAILEEIFRLTLQSPSGYNLQPWRFVVVQAQENKDKLRECAFDQRQVSEAPVVVICCGDRRVGSSDYIESVIDLGRQQDAMTDAYAEVIRQQVPGLFENKPCFETMEAWTNRHTMLAVAHMLIVAKSLGVDSCPMEGFSSSQVKAAFAIPDEVDVCCLVALGYAAEEPAKRYGGRFEISQVFFGERFGDRLPNHTL